MRNAWSKAHCRLIRIRMNWESLRLLENKKIDVVKAFTADDEGWRAILKIVDDQALFDREVHGK